MDLNKDTRASGLQQASGETERLNRGCFCVTLDRNALIKALHREVGSQGFAQALASSHPSLFSNIPVFVPAETLIEMTRVIEAVETAARLPAYREGALSWAPPIDSEEINAPPKPGIKHLGRHTS